MSEHTHVHTLAQTSQRDVKNPLASSIPLFTWSFFYSHPPLRLCPLPSIPSYPPLLLSSPLTYLSPPLPLPLLLLRLPRSDESTPAAINSGSVDEMTASDDFPSQQVYSPLTETNSTVTSSAVWFQFTNMGNEDSEGSWDWNTWIIAPDFFYCQSFTLTVYLTIWSVTFMWQCKMKPLF